MCRPPAAFWLAGNRGGGAAGAGPEPKRLWVGQAGGRARRSPGAGRRAGGMLELGDAPSQPKVIKHRATSPGLQKRQPAPPSPDPAPPRSIGCQQRCKELPGCLGPPPGAVARRRVGARLAGRGRAGAACTAKPYRDLGGPRPARLRAAAHWPGGVWRGGRPGRPRAALCPLCCARGRSNWHPATLPGRWAPGCKMPLPPTPAAATDELPAVQAPRRLLPPHLLDMCQ